MSSTISTLVTDVKDRLNIGTTGSIPSDPMLTRWLQSAFKTLIALLPPVQETTRTVDGDRQVSLTADQVFFVANGPHLLFASEWAKQESSIILQPASVKDGDPVTVWYFSDPDIDGTTTTVNTTCIFGTDWLESLAVLKVLFDAEGRLSHTAGSNDDSGHGGAQRVYEQKYNEEFALAKQRHAEWFNSMQQRLQDRAAFGVAPPKNPPRAGFINRSEVIANLFAQGDTS